MSPVFVIAAKDLKQRFRDRSAIVLGFVAPLGIAALMSFAFRGADRFHITVGVVDRDHGPLATAFASFMQNPALHGVVTVRTVPDEATARRLVRNGSLSSAIVVPPGFSAAASGEGATGTGPAGLAVRTSVNPPLGRAGGRARPAPRGRGCTGEASGRAGRGGGEAARARERRERTDRIATVEGSELL